MDDIEKDIIYPPKKSNIQRKYSLENTYNYTSGQWVCWIQETTSTRGIDNKIQQLVLNGDSLDKLDKDTIASFR